ncbi:exported protein of unknown function [Candidatus Filomicrobium marinum]|uniref:Uncharacterized protein n=1 Tax=Candidatus Filomicrobium marinum TaxID=1608628 RepID=A0A0D6JC04_9HYPH|nr:MULTISPECIES: hypothetical protein [Filomicrobium]MCV0371864.1 hypothetical protein [Filomicrobium sp.]CFX05011.1 exported protein of unknown function [Candidatus Filomicrobium marinum]CPR16164.1 exported protein of unknown function [Candidatus Filomicrobium marinum]
MAGIGKILSGTFVFMIAVVLSFTIIGIIFALPMFTAAFALWTAGFAELGFKSAKVVARAVDKGPGQNTR